MKTLKTFLIGKRDRRKEREKIILHIINSLDHPSDDKLKKVNQFIAKSLNS